MSAHTLQMTTTRPGQSPASRFPIETTSLSRFMLLLLLIVCNTCRPNLSSPFANLPGDSLGRGLLRKHLGPHNHDSLRLPRRGYHQ